MSSQRTVLSRQWIPMVGGSCDVRMGFDAYCSAAKVMRDAVGQPHLCVFVVAEGIDNDVLDELTRQAISVGFECQTLRITQPVRQLASVVSLTERFAELGLTADDLCCAVGNADLMSFVSCACGSWCQATSMLAIPTDEVGLLDGALVPRSLDVRKTHDAFAVRPCARHALLDLNTVLRPQEEESACYARVLMVATAMASSEREFSELWDRAEAIMSGDEDVRRTQLLDTAKARGKLSASTAVAIRSSLQYGQTFASALKLLDAAIPRSICVAEGMRFFARIAVAQGKISLDDMLAQDELLDALGIPLVECDIDAPSLFATLNAERRHRSRRVLWEVPLALGRVRLATVEEEMLEEHARAWCESHRS